MDPGPRVPGLHRVEGRLVEAVLASPTLAGEVKLGVFPAKNEKLLRPIFFLFDIF